MSTAKVDTVGFQTIVISDAETKVEVDLRAAKAAYLYSEKVVVLSSRAYISLARLLITEDLGHAEREFVEALSGFMNFVPPDWTEEAPLWPYYDEEEKRSDITALGGLFEASAARKIAWTVDSEKIIQLTIGLMMGHWGPQLGIPMIDPESARRMQGFTEVTLRKSFPEAPGLYSESAGDGGIAEGLLVSQLLGELEVYPHAKWDELSDVRSLLQPSVTHLRAAISGAAGELRDLSPGTLERAARDVRVRLIAPALAEVNQEMEDLGARSTLRRIASRPSAATSTGAVASLIASASSGSSIATAASLAVAAASATVGVAQEVAERANIRRRWSANPYWLFREGSY